MTSAEIESELPVLLEQMKLGELRDIARQRGWQVRGSSRSDYIASLVPLLSDPTQVARAVISLSEPLREALRASFVAEDGNGVTPVALAQVISAWRREPAKAIKPVEAAGLLLDLARCGLVLPWRSSSNGLCYLFPWEVQRQVPALPGWCGQWSPGRSGQILSAPAEYCLRLLDEVWEAIVQCPPALRPVLQPPAERRLAALLQDWPYDLSEVEPLLSKHGFRTRAPPQALNVPPPAYFITDDSMERLLPLTAGDKEQLEFVGRLLSELELVSSVDGHLVARPEAMARFCADSAPERHQAVARAYLSLQDWAELDVLLRTDARLVLQRSAHAPLSFTHFRSQLVVVRQMILRFLSTAGQDGWCRFSDFEAALQRLWHTFYPVLENQEWLTRAPVQAWHLAWRQEQRLPFARLATSSESNSHPNWPAVQGVVWRLMLEKPLRWLGLAELWQEEREVVAFRLRGLADLLWDRPAVRPLVGSEANGTHDAVAAPAEQQSPGAITLRESDTTIHVHPGLVSLSVLIFLGSIANLEQASAQRFTYRLSMREVHAAFMKGKSLSDLLAEWEDSVALPMPDSIRRALSGWWAAYGQVHLYDGLALLDLRDGITLDELEASTALGQYMLARLSERLVVVPEERVDDLLREFTAKGHTPKEIW